MSFLTSMFGETVEAKPTTVNEAIGDLTVALENLAAVSVDRRAEAAALFEQSKVLADNASAAEAEADRADRIHENIAKLLA